MMMPLQVLRTVLEPLSTEGDLQQFAEAVHAQMTCCAWPLASWEWRNRKEHGDYYNWLYRDYYKDPFLYSSLT